MIYIQFYVEGTINLGLMHTNKTNYEALFRRFFRWFSFIRPSDFLCCLWFVNFSVWGI